MSYGQVKDFLKVTPYPGLFSDKLDFGVFSWKQFYKKEYLYFLSIGLSKGRIH